MTRPGARTEDRIDPRMPIALLPMGGGLRSRLARLGVTAIGDAARLSMDALLGGNFGPNSVRRLEQLLARCGLHLDMRSPDLPKTFAGEWTISDEYAEDALAHWLGHAGLDPKWQRVAIRALGADGKRPQSFASLARELGV